MKKENYRDYVAEAFRYYALCGKPTAQEIRQLRSGLPSGNKGALADLEAVERVIERLSGEPDGELSLRCLELVYFSHPRRAPTRGALTQRVRYTVNELCISEATVYRSLRRTRLLMAMERGLRVSESDLEDFFDAM